MEALHPGSYKAKALVLETPRPANSLMPPCPRTMLLHIAAFAVSSSTSVRRADRWYSRKQRSPLPGRSQEGSPEHRQGRPARPDQDPRLKERARRVGIALFTKWYNNATGLCCPAVRTVATHLGWSERTVQRGLRDLETTGYVRAKLRGQHSTPLYHLPGMELLPPEVSPLAPRGDSSDRPEVTAGVTPTLKKDSNLEERGNSAPAPAASLSEAAF
jgi:hypothetical protein